MLVFMKNNPDTSDAESSQAITEQRAVCDKAEQGFEAFITLQVKAVVASAVTAMPTKACGVSSKSAAVSMLIQVQLPNGISVDLRRARMPEVSGVMQIPCHYQMYRLDVGLITFR